MLAIFNLCTKLYLLKNLFIFNNILAQQAKCVIKKHFIHEFKKYLIPKDYQVNNGNVFI